MQFSTISAFVAISQLWSLAIASAAPTIKNFTLEWKDDFKGTKGSLPSTTNWIIDTGTSYVGGPANWGTGEIENYTASTENVHLSGNGQLWIVPIRDSTGGWTSARIETVKTDFMAPVNKKMIIQASIAIPAVTTTNGLGYWPAFWALGHEYRDNYTNWPACGEYDIMENVNGGNWAQQTLHCDVAPDGICNEDDGIYGVIDCADDKCEGNFHTYTVEIDRTVTPEAMNFLVDGNLNHVVTETTLGSAIWNQTVHEGVFLLLNVAMGGSFPDGLAGETTPTSKTVSGKPMRVDYVAVYYSN